MQTSIMDRVQMIFQDVFDEPKLRIDRSSSAATVPEWDSLAHINLVTTIEQEFRIKFALGELEQLTNVGDLLDLMERKITSRR
jgi:acyl carrier protein